MFSLLSRIDRTGVPLALARLVLAVVFIGMGWSKAGDPVAFLKLLREYEALPDSTYVLQNTIAVTLPWIEIACGVALLLGVAIRGSALTLLGMLTVFTVLIAWRAWRIHQGGTPFCDIAFDCGCGSGVVNVCAKLPENIGLWLLSWIPLLSRSRRFCLEDLFGRSAPQTQVPEPA